MEVGAAHYQATYPVIWMLSFEWFLWTILNGMLEKVLHVIKMFELIHNIMCTNLKTALSPIYLFERFFKFFLMNNAAGKLNCTCYLAVLFSIIAGEQDNHSFRQGVFYICQYIPQNRETYNSQSHTFQKVNKVMITSLIFSITWSRWPIRDVSSNNIWRLHIFLNSCPFVPLYMRS